MGLYVNAADFMCLITWFRRQFWSVFPLHHHLPAVEAGDASTTVAPALLRLERDIEVYYANTVSTKGLSVFGNF